MKITYHLEVFNEDPMTKKIVEFESLDKLEQKVKSLNKHNLDYMAYKIVEDEQSNVETFLIN